MREIFAAEDVLDAIFTIIGRGRILRALGRAQRDEVRNHLSRKRRRRDLALLEDGAEYAYDWHLLRHEDALRHQVDRIRELQKV